MEKRNKNCLKKQVKNQVAFTALGCLVVLNSQSCTHLPHHMDDGPNKQSSSKEVRTGLDSLMSSSSGEALATFPSRQDELDHLKTMREQYSKEKAMLEETKRSIIDRIKKIVQEEKEYYGKLQGVLSAYRNRERDLQAWTPPTSSVWNNSLARRDEILTQIEAMEMWKQEMPAAVDALKNHQEEKNYFQSQYNKLQQEGNSVENNENLSLLKALIAQSDRRIRGFEMLTQSVITEYFEPDIKLMSNQIRTEEEKEAAILSVISGQQRIISIMNEIDNDQEISQLDSERFDNRIRSFQDKIDQVTDKINRLQEALQTKE